LGWEHLAGLLTLLFVNEALRVDAEEIQENLVLGLVILLR